MSNWQQDLHQSIAAHETNKQALGQEKQQQDRNVENFFRLKVLPAFEEFKTVLEEQGREVTIGQGLEEVTIKVMFKGEEEIKYGVQAKVYGTRVVVHPVQFFSEEGQRYKGEGFFRSGIQNYSVDDLTKEEIIQHLLSEYKSRLQYLAQNR